MKISCKNEFHSLVSSLRSLLSEAELSIKTSRAQELFSHAFGYKSANGLLANLPIELKITDQVISRLASLLKERHDFDGVDIAWLLRVLERKHVSYSTHYECENDCYPSELPPGTNYWYLTREGWLPWSHMDLKNMRVELNIYKVISAFTSQPLLPGEGAFFRAARPIWTADIASNVFEGEADRLERKYGEMPENNLMYPEMSDAL